MDCQTALQILEVARPGQDDLSDPELAEAAAYVELHPQCRNEFLHRQELDRQVAQLMCDVPVPAGLKERLLVGLVEGPAAEERDGSADDEATDESAAAMPAAPLRPAVHRRAWFRALVSSAVCLVAGIIVWQLLPSKPEPIEVGELQAQLADAIASADFHFDDLEKFQNSYEAKLPPMWEYKLGSAEIDGPRAYVGDETGEKAVALFRFRFLGAGKTPVTGYVVAVPANRIAVADRPPWASTISGGYVVIGNAASVKWTTGDLVYICFVPGKSAAAAHRHLERLVDQLNPPLS